MRSDTRLATWPDCCYFAIGSVALHCLSKRPDPLAFRSLVAYPSAHERRPTQFHLVSHLLDKASRVTPRSAVLAECADLLSYLSQSNHNCFSFAARSLFPVPCSVFLGPPSPQQASCLSNLVCPVSLPSPLVKCHFILEAVRISDTKLFRARSSPLIVNV